MQIKKIAENIYEVGKEGKMRVPMRVFVNEKMLEDLHKDKSLEQGMNIATLPGIQKWSIMLPDAHQGYGFPIGGVGAFDTEEGIISPGGVGYDINCGVRFLTSNLDKKDAESKIDQLVQSIFRHIPSGVGSKSQLRLNDTELAEVLNTGMKWTLRKGYAGQEDLDCCEESGSMPQADAKKVSSHAFERGRSQLGTLGAGNHFGEVQIVEKIHMPEIAERMGITHEGQIGVMIHSGSRGLGHQTCGDYLKKANDEFHELIRSLPDRELVYFPAKTQLAKDYFGAMAASANYAWANRQLMTFQMRKAFEEVFGPGGKLTLIYDVAHNICKLEDHEINGSLKKLYVHRKGATRAFGPGHKDIPEKYRGIGQPIILPGSMGTGSYLLIGTEKAMKETFGSTAHGAGRMLSRHEANKQYRGEKVKNDLLHLNIHVKSASWRGLSEEAPGAYKNIDDVAHVSDSVGIGKIVAKLKPFGLIKG